MIKLLVSVALFSSFLTGCSTPKVKAERPPYCITEQKTVLENGSIVNSETVVECTDDQVKRVTKHRMGIAPTCGTFTYWTRKGGYNVQRQGISCQKPNGDWEIVRTSY